MGKVLDITPRLPQTEKISLVDLLSNDPEFRVQVQRIRKIYKQMILEMVDDE